MICLRRFTPPMTSRIPRSGYNRRSPPLMRHELGLISGGDLRTVLTSGDQSSISGGNLRAAGVAARSGAGDDPAAGVGRLPDPANETNAHQHQPPSSPQVHLTGELTGPAETNPLGRAPPCTRRRPTSVPGCGRPVWRSSTALRRRPRRCRRRPSAGGRTGARSPVRRNGRRRGR